MHENTAGAAACSIRRVDCKRLSDNDILTFGIPDFMKYLGKGSINPGGIEGRDRLLGILQPGPDSHVLVCGPATVQTACLIAREHRCMVTAIECSTSSASEAQALVSRLGLGDRVHCEVGNIAKLPFADNTFDYVVCLAGFAYAPHQDALSEAGRVLKDAGIVAGLELCWRRVPPDPLRERTAHIFGCKGADFHSLFGWVGALRESNFDLSRAEEYPIQSFNATALLRDEGWANGLRVLIKLMRRRANRERMAEIRAHFSRNLDYYGYAVFSGCKSRKSFAARHAQQNGALRLQSQRA